MSKQRTVPENLAVTVLIPRRLLQAARESVMRVDPERGRLNSRVVIYALERLVARK